MQVPPCRMANDAMLGEPSLHGSVDCIVHSGDGDRVRVRDMVDALGENAFAPMLLLPALLVFSPASSILGVATVSGILIALLASELLVRRRTIWLPAVLLDRSIARSKLRWVQRKIDRPLRWTDRWSRPRLTALVQRPLGLVPGVICVAIGLALPIMELIPLSATIGGAAVSFMVMGLLLQDGLLCAIGLCIAVVVGLIAWNAAAWLL